MTTATDNWVFYKDTDISPKNNTFQIRQQKYTEYFKAKYL